MRVAILSAGPSLLHTFDPRETFNLRVAVNAAAGVVHADWWVAGDAQTFARVRPIGVPVMLTMNNTDEPYREHAERTATHRFCSWDWLMRSTDAPSQASNWSITMAIALSVLMRADQVDIFGHDATGTVDVCGFDLMKRTDNWKRQADDYESVVAWAESRGVRVSRRIL